MENTALFRAEDAPRQRTQRVPALGARRRTDADWTYSTDPMRHQDPSGPNNSNNSTNPTKENSVSTAIESPTSSQAVPTVTGISHVGITVRDIAASEAWYSNVLGLVRAFVEPHATGDGYAIVMTPPGTGLFVGLEHHPDADSQYFSPRRTGLDHLALQLAAREDIDRWITHLDAVGVEHEAPFETTEPVPHALVLVRDPDGIPIELFWFGGADDQ